MSNTNPTPMRDWSKPPDGFPPPPPGTPAPRPPRAMVEPPPAEIIGDLDWIDYQESWFLGPRVTLTGKRRRREMLKHAARLLDEGTPFIFDGRRIPGSAAACGGFRGNPDRGRDEC